MSDHIPLLPPYFARWIGFVLSRVAEMSNAEFEHALRPLGISGRHLGILIILANLGPQVQARLSDPTHIDKGAMVALVNELVQMGCVRRTPHPEDKRAVLVHLTDNGRAVMEEATILGEQVTVRLFSVLSAAEQQHLRDLLTRIAANTIVSQDDETPSDPPVIQSQIE